ncbi:hypothetical protein IMG5_108670 [Ichthyophthirius multifiliis]|uniref:NADH:flavin oxidoreductase/NADH oxidase N-terminal domain-containing protein n=1 Tax=Ichthyophthirius multifiliis TaxID=5932 RepID=G0QTH8_ICHMU|nr:hypothetical protein IMG5_108670 [Ichthyophthirius multifiliis]EGR31474.1 hypothetical protein IMG5_108670 [Ichthyophthirius multifiliis]|eukprot:XP_004034960.1 hypothetical protein IMG5_108670 [Ichthyophthirius multifiliis]
MGCGNSNIVNDGINVKNPLISPYKLVNVPLKNRIVMAAMTRCRANPADGIASDLIAKYYSQRASFGLIFTECSAISPLSNAFPGCACIYNQSHMEGWKKVVKAVHEKNGKIYIQIFHSGRSTMKEQLNGESPIGPSPIAINENHPYFKTPYPVPKEMTVEDIQQVRKEFQNAFKLAKQAGFDGVQIHAANGYLLDEFLRDGSNNRSDQYGGSIENRCRFVLEVLDDAIKILGKDNVGIRFSPTGRYNDMYDSNPLKLMEYMLTQCSNRKIGHIELKRHAPSEKTSEGKELPEKQIPDFFRTLKPFIKNTTYILNESISLEEAKQLIMDNVGDLVSFARYAINNPDLPARIENNWEINQNYDYSTFFTGGEKGYTDWETHQTQ